MECRGAAPIPYRMVGVATPAPRPVAAGRRHRDRSVALLQFLDRVVLRLVLGALQMLLSVLVAASVLPSLTDPAGRVATRVTEVTGIAGDGPVRALLNRVDSGPWPVIVLVTAVIGALAGVWILVTGRRWPKPGRKYAAKGADDAAVVTGQKDSAGSSREDEWDALTRGEDPT